VPSDLTTTFYATATDAVGNASACSAGRSYVEDSTPPLAPSPSGTNPASPANDNAPRVTGSAPTGTTVTLYTTPNCSGAAVGAGSAGAFASAGIEVTVIDNSTTTFYARATDPAGHVSTCSVGSRHVAASLGGRPGLARPPSRRRRGAPAPTRSRGARRTAPAPSRARCGRSRSGGRPRRRRPWPRRHPRPRPRVPRHARSQAAPASRAAR